MSYKSLFLLASALSTKPIVNDRMTIQQRDQVMKHHFEPPIGDEVRIQPDLVVDHRNIKNDLEYFGFIEITPPKNSCFTVTRNKKLQDQKVCKKKKLSFNMAMLASDGSLTWKISTGKSDFGNYYTWTSKHRLAHVIEYKKKFPREVALADCLVSKDGDMNIIHLPLLNGLKWTIKIPPKLPKVVEKKPNRKKVKSSKDDNPEVKKGSTTDHWVISSKNSYRLDAKFVKLSDGPIGTKGECRIQFSDTPGDPKGGWLECHHIDMYDVVDIRLGCVSEISSQYQ